MGWGRDAVALAAALSRFLAGEPPVTEPARNPDRDRLRGVVSGLSQQLGVGPNVASGMPADSWLRERGGRQFLREFVEFCKRGSFRMR